MFVSRRSFWGLLFVGLLSVGLLAGPALAWPDKPIAIYCGWAAGGASDVVTRCIAREMEKKLGQKILVTNVTGALGGIAATQVKNAPADGYLWFGGAAVAGTYPVLGHSQASWNDFYAFLPVVFPTTIYVKMDAPWKNAKEFIADIKKGSKTFRFGSPGAGSNGAIFGGLVAEAGGVLDKIQHVPYKGGREAGRYLLSGDVDFISVTMGDLTDWAVAKRIRPLTNLYPKDIESEGVVFPSIARDYPDLVPYKAINPYFGVYLRRETPEDILIKVAEAFLFTIEQKQFIKVAATERAGVMAPLMGLESDKMMSQIESARGWALWDLKTAKNDPARFGIPRLKDWTWPPHERAKKARPWPAKIEEMAKTLNK